MCAVFVKLSVPLHQLQGCRIEASSIKSDLSYKFNLHSHQTTTTITVNIISAYYDHTEYYVLQLP